ncbi:MAG: hypothetical protein JWL86_2994 [Rhizobium sp.]|nr:hypothetical protein [Rhizobium sp.]
MSEEGRWAGRNTAKDVVRNRIWLRLEETRVRPDQFETIPSSRSFATGCSTAGKPDDCYQRPSHARRSRGDLLRL